MAVTHRCGRDVTDLPLNTPCPGCYETLSADTVTTAAEASGTPGAGLQQGVPAKPTRPCPACGADNRLAAPRCKECASPLDLDRLPEASVVLPDGSQLVLSPGIEVVLGRGHQPVLQPWDNVSRVHASIMLQEDGSIVVLDRGSTNGTWVNGAEIGPGEQRVVVAGDEIRLGIGSGPDGRPCLLRLASTGD